MTVILCSRNGFVLLSLGAALLLAIGCNADPSTSRIEPGGAPATRRLEDMEKDVEKDLKPPVIIKPNLPPATGTEQAQPKQDLRSSEHSIDLEVAVSRNGLDVSEFAETSFSH